MKIGKQIKVVSYYPPEDIAELDKLAANTRITKSEYFREALRDLLNKYSASSRSSATKSKKNL